MSSGTEELRRRVPAVADQLGDLRHALTEWAARLGLAAHTVEDLVLATYEAMANVVEHAYRGCVSGLLELSARADRAAGTVTVTVADHGHWRPPPVDRGVRGRGLLLVRDLPERAEVRPSDHGTIVTMTYRMA